MTDRTVVVRLRADVADYLAGQLRAQAATNKTTQSLGGVEKRALSTNEAMKRVTTSIGLLGVGLVGVAGLAVKTFADWDARMAQVKSLSHASVQEMASLRNATKGFATDFGVSASQAADAEIELVKAGVSVKDILGGALKSSLTLAAAGQLDVGRATEIAASAMTQFGLAGKDVGHIADLLAAGADKALGSVDDLGQGLKFVGPVAANLNVSIDQTVGTLSELAQAGILGEQAGTGLRGVLQALVSPSQQAQKVMDKYGITLFDTQGKFIGLAGLAGQLQDHLGGLSDAEKNAALGFIFGNQQITAATVLMKGGAGAVTDWTNKVNDQGFAAEQAAGKLDSLQGDVQKLHAAFQNDLISSGSGANNVLRTMAQRVTDLVEGFGALPTGVQQSMLWITGGAGLVALGVAGVGKLTIAVSRLKTALETLKISARTAGGAFGAIGVALTVAAAAFAIWGSKQAKAKQEIDDLTQSLDQNTAAITDNTRATVFKHLQDSGVIDDAKQLSINLDDLTDAALGSSEALARVKAEAQISNDHASADLMTYQEILRAIGGQSDYVAASQKKVRDAIAAGVGVTDEATTAATGLAQAQEGSAAASDDAAKALDQWRQATADSDAAFVDLGDAFDTVAQKAKSMSKTAKVSAADYITELQKQVAAQRSWERNLTQISDRVNSTMSGDMRDAANNMIDELIQLGPKGAAQVQLLHDMSDRQLRRVVKLYEQKGAEAAGNFAQKIEDSRAPQLPTPTISDTADAVSSWLAHQQAILNHNPLHAAVKQVRAQYAGGGSVAGPGSGTSDSVLARLSNGEHVLTASDVQKAGGQGAVYRMRGMIQAGLLRFATGGAVGSARHAMDAAYARWRAHRKAKDADQLRQDYEDARDKYTRLVDLQRTVTTDVRRGDTVSNVTSGLSGAYGVIDQILDESRNPDLSKKARGSLAATGAKAEKALKGLYAQSDAIAKRLDDAKNTLEDLSQIKSNVAGALSGEFSLSGALGTMTHVTAARLVGYATAKANAIKAFGSKLATLQKMGLSGPILQEIAQLGTAQGTEVADALIAGGAGSIKDLNAAYASVGQYANAAGTTVTKGFYPGGIDAAQGFVDGLTKQQANIDAQIAGWGTTLANSMLKALGLPTKTAKKKAAGGWVIGPGSGTSDSVPLLASNGEFVMNAGAAARYASQLEAMNAGLWPQYAAAGSAGDGSRSLTVQVAAKDESGKRLASQIVTKVRDVNAALGLIGR